MFTGQMSRGEMPRVTKRGANYDQNSRTWKKKRPQQDRKKDLEHATSDPVVSLTRHGLSVSKGERGVFMRRFTLEGFMS